jgi:hypothetical protein
MFGPNVFNNSNCFGNGSGDGLDCNCLLWFLLMSNSGCNIKCGDFMLYLMLQNCCSKEKQSCGCDCK